MNDENLTKARRIIASNQYMTIATSDENAEPWNTPVYYAFDDKSNFYWYSGKNTKHSQLITKNNKVAIVIFNSNASEEDAGGVYITGKAYEVNKEELAHALEIYFNRAIPDNPEEKSKVIEAPQDFLGESELRMYKIIPEKIYVSNDATKWNGKWIDSRSEVNLMR